MKLVIAEKPSVAKEIAKAIDEDNPFGPYDTKKGYIECNGYIVSWCFGHLLQLFSPDDYGEQWKAWSFEHLPMIPEKWRFKLLRKCADQFKLLKNLMFDNRIDEIICATDADREGECIFRYVYYNSGCRKRVQRLWISSLEESAIKEGFSKLMDMEHYNSLFSAGFSRAKADWLIGMNGTRLFTLRYGTKLTVGRVQTPTLAMIVKRYNDVKNFQREKYYTVEIDCGEFTASTERITEQANAERICSAVSGKTAKVSEIKKEKKTVNPPKLYDLTTLQREANKIYGYTAAQTLEYTQKLYEAKLVTYPRTDSQYLTDAMEQTAINCVKAVYSVFSDYGTVPQEINVKRCINNKKVESHHAIIPTEEIKKADINALPFGEKNILRLVSAKLILAIESPYQYEAVSVALNCENHDFFVKGRNTISIGWKAHEEQIKGLLKTNQSDKEEKEEDNITLPPVSEGQAFEIVSSVVSEHWTTPPQLYTENSLLSAMERAGNEDYDSETEKKGIGTPATRATIIEGLTKNGYIERKGKKIIPTEKGIELINVVPQEIKSPKTTAEWEMQLQQIEKGRCTSDAFLHSITEYVKELCSKYAVRSTESTFKELAPSKLGSCPKCGQDVLKGKFGAYCKGKCGMNVGKVYGKELTDNQLVSLLSGKPISYTRNGRKTTVSPQIEPNNYNGKLSYQWKTI